MLQASYMARTGIGRAIATIRCQATIEDKPAVPAASHLLLKRGYEINKVCGRACFASAGGWFDSALSFDLGAPVTIEKIRRRDTSDDYDDMGGHMSDDERAPLSTKPPL